MTLRILVCCFILSLFTGCATTKGKDSESGATVEDRSSAGSSSGADSDESGATSYGAGSGQMGDLSQLDDPQSPLSVRVIYFEYDSSDIQPQFRDIIEAHSNFLSANSAITVVLEGHADERGSREYNLALGERRALAVKRQMTLLGVPASQIRTTSYGEERPVVDGHDENAWSQNRRVEIIY